VEGRGGDGGSKGEDGDGGSQGVGLAKRELGRRMDVDGMKKLTRLSPGHLFKRAKHVAGSLEGTSRRGRTSSCKCFRIYGQKRVRPAS
jgi:hypothetical protein